LNWGKVNNDHRCIGNGSAFHWEGILLEDGVNFECAFYVGVLHHEFYYNHSL
jgi:hypothetical protein